MVTNGHQTDKKTLASSRRKNYELFRWEEIATKTSRIRGEKSMQLFEFPFIVIKKMVNHVQQKSKWMGETTLNDCILARIISKNVLWP